MGDEPMLELESRRRIFEHVARHPGAYLRELQRDLGLAMGALEYHLARLEEAQLVAVEEGEQKRFFPREVPPPDRRILALLRQDACRRIALALLEVPGRSAPEVQRTTGLVRGTVAYHLSKLESAGLATAMRDVRPARWALTDRAHVHSILVRYRPTFVDRVLDRALDAMDAFGLE